MLDTTTDYQGCHIHILIAATSVAPQECQMSLVKVSHWTLLADKTNK